MDVFICLSYCKAKLKWTELLKKQPGKKGHSNKAGYGNTEYALTNLVSIYFLVSHISL